MPAAIPIAIAATTAGATILSSHAQSSAINNATDAQTAANERALELQEKQYNQQRQDYAPWRAVGLGALQQLAQTENIRLPDGFFQGQISGAVSTANGQTVTGPGSSGVDEYVKSYQAAHNGAYPPGYTPPTTPPATIPPGTTPPTTPPATTPPTTPPGTTPPNPGAANADGQFGAFYASPDYQFRLDQGTRAITGNKAAAGLLDSGALGKGLINYGQAAGSQEFGNWYNRIAALAGVGQTATNASTQAGENATNAMTGLITSQGNNLASSYLSQGRVTSGLTSTLGGLAGGLVSNWGGMGGGVGGYTSTPEQSGTLSGGLFGSPI